MDASYNMLVYFLGEFLPSVEWTVPVLRGDLLSPYLFQQMSVCLVFCFVCGLFFFFFSSPLLVGLLNLVCLWMFYLATSTGFFCSAWLFSRLFKPLLDLPFAVSSASHPAFSPCDLEAF